MITRLEFDDGDRHRKFWQIEVLDLGTAAVTNQEWGKLDDSSIPEYIQRASHHNLTKTFPDLETAQKYADRLIKSKLRKGYVALWGVPA